MELRKGVEQTMPKEGYRWNTMGFLYEKFYKEYSNYSLKDLIKIFNQSIEDIIESSNKKRYRLYFGTSIIQTTIC